MHSCFVESDRPRGDAPRLPRQHSPEGECGIVSQIWLSTDERHPQTLFQCLVDSCHSNSYGDALGFAISTCSALGASIRPLHPIEVHRADLVRRQDIPTEPGPVLPNPSIVGGPSIITFNHDVSIELNCRAGPDGLVTLSVPAPASAGTHFANPELGSDGSSNVGSVTTLASSSDYSFSTKPVSRTFQQGNGGRHGPTENLDCQSTTLSTSTEGPSGSAAAQSTACPCTQSAPGAPSFSRPTQTYASQPSAQFSLSTTSPDSGNFPSQTTQLSTRDCDEPSSLFSLTTTTTSPVSTLTQSTTFGTVSSTSRPESTDCSEEMLRLTPTPPMPFSLPTASSVWSTSTIPSVQSLASSGHCSNSSSSYTSTSFTSSTSLSSSSCTDETTTSSSSTQHHSTTTSLVSTDCESAVTSSTQHTQPSHGSASLRQATINTTSTSHTESSRSSSFSSQSVVLTTGPAEYTTAPSTPPAYLPPLNEYSFLSTPPLYGSSISSSSHTTVLNTGTGTTNTLHAASTRETTQEYVYGPTTALLAPSLQLPTHVLAASATERRDEGIARDSQRTDYDDAPLRPAATASQAKARVVQVTIISLGAGGRMETSVVVVQQDAPLPTGLALVANPPEGTELAGNILTHADELTAPSPHGLSTESLGSEPSTLKRVEGTMHTVEVAGETAAMVEATPMIVTGSATPRKPLRTALYFAVGLAVFFLGGTIAG